MKSGRSQLDPLVDPQDHNFVVLALVAGHLAALRAAGGLLDEGLVAQKLAETLEVVAGTRSMDDRFGTLAHAARRVARRWDGKEELQDLCTAELHRLFFEFGHRDALDIVSMPSAMGEFVSAVRQCSKNAPQGYYSHSHELKGEHWLKGVHAALSRVGGYKASFKTAARGYGAFKRRSPEELESWRAIYQVLAA